MAMLDEHRAVSFLAQKSQRKVEEVTHVTVWGNHSSTQVPDFVNAKINGRPATEMIQDRQWLEKEFVAKVQQRGAVVIAARGKSSAASAAHAALEAMRALFVPTAKERWFSMGVMSDGNPYGVQPGVVFSFPCRSQGKGKIEIVKGLQWDGFLTSQIALTEKELLEERAMVQELL
jgi:malate/lactate dehydrogenase